MAGMFDTPGKGMLNPLTIMGLQMMAANQPRPYNQGPNTLGSVLGRAGIGTVKHLQSERAQQAKTDARAAAAQYRQDTLDVRQEGVDIRKANAKALTKHRTRSKTITSGALTGYSVESDGKIRAPGGEVLGSEGVRQLVAKHKQSSSGQNSTALVPMNDPDDPERVVMGRLMGGRVMPVRGPKGKKQDDLRYGAAQSRLAISGQNSRTAQGNLKARQVDNLIDANRIARQNVSAMFPKATQGVQAIGNYLRAKHRGTNEAQIGSSLIIAYLHAKYPGDTSFNQDQLDAVYSEMGLVESVGTKLSSFFAGRPQLRTDVKQDMENFILSYQDDLINRMAIMQADFQESTGQDVNVIPGAAQPDLGDIPAHLR